MSEYTHGYVAKCKHGIPQGLIVDTGDVDTAKAICSHDRRGHTIERMTIEEVRLAPIAHCEKCKEEGAHRTPDRLEDDYFADDDWDDDDEEAP